MLVTNTSEQILNKANVNQEVLGFYRELLCTSSNTVAIEVRKGAISFSEDARALIKPVKIVEVEATIWGIDTLNAPGQMVGIYYSLGRYG